MLKNPLPSVPKARDLFYLPIINQFHIKHALYVINTYARGIVK